ncbi:MAG: hypothetical protein WCR54_05565 [Clostridia bacterium]
MKNTKFNRIIIIILILCSIIFFVLQQLFFHDIHESEFLIFQDLLFLPIEILLVTFILDKVLHNREKKQRLEQLNTLIGVFFNEMGNNIITLLNPYISNLKDVQELLNIKSDWEDKDFNDTIKKIRSYSFKADYTLEELEQLKSDLLRKKTSLIQIFNNPSLFEHDTFSNMLWALYHLINELENRLDISFLPATDISHLSGDIVRAYGLLIPEWLMYMNHLKKNYPYLWSLALRSNPFAPNNSIIIK